LLLSLSTGRYRRRAAVLGRIAENMIARHLRTVELLRQSRKHHMNDLLAGVIEAHGGLDRWKALDSPTPEDWTGWWSRRRSGWE
jgi:hypothetical protein